MKARPPGAVDNQPIANDEVVHGRQATTVPRVVVGAAADSVYRDAMRWWVVLCVLLSRPALAGESRFYFSGDGTLRLHHAHFAGEVLEVRYRQADGSYDPAALKQIAHFFRNRTDGEQGTVSLRLIELLDYVQDRYRPKRMTLVSGYRSPQFNQSLRAGGRKVAEASVHTEGLAADVQLAGLKLRPVWNQLRAEKTGGVGLYAGEGFIHLDAGQPRFWEAATSGVDKNLAKENARLFARTEFDRYATLDGAAIRLHSVTALPLAIARTAHLGDAALTLEPRSSFAHLEGDCWVWRVPPESYELGVSSVIAAPTQPMPIRLSTCEPRIGATPAEVLTNPIERLAVPPP
ncbi:MAG: DUF882 domain-containing protein [Deltaproteobacteria bacterium]|nr:DUF882 domain-containing protein [Deltaproteobacteria bacterium]